jgi:hypothetical protein
MLFRILPAALVLLSVLSAQSKITRPREVLGFDLGDDYQMASYSQLETYWKKLATESDRMKLVDIGLTGEGRHQYMAILTSPENHRRLAHFQEINRRLALAENLSDEQAHQLAREGKAVVWIDGGLHANETVGSQQLMETVYQLASRNDPETLRFLDDVIILCVQANPDGQEIVANWYMREKDPLKRTLAGLPRLYNKYIGHDDNRDFYMSNMPETTNMNRQMFIEWFPEIVYNHHQTGPEGAVIFMPPFRDPFNYNFDPLIPLGIELVGTAMHSRLIAEGKGGSAMRTGANYSTWWNGGLRTITYFHNMIGLLTEIIGSPTPIDIPLVPEKQLPTGDWPMPIAPQKWHYRQSIEYEITNNRAVLDVASRYRETFLYNLYRMGRNSIEKGGRDNWTITPKRIEALKAAAPKDSKLTTVPSDLYAKVLHDPQYRDPRGYIIPANQADFATATKFINTLEKNGITVLRANAGFTAGGKSYPAGSFVIQAAQAFRPHVMDMFEPQDHPNDFRYPGGPPNTPYDVTGWTLAYQMGVQFDRVLEKFDGPFTKVNGVQPMPAALVTGAAHPAGFLITHRANNSFIVVNHLLKAGADVYWMKKEQQADGESLGTGAIWVPEAAGVLPILKQATLELGLTVHGVTHMPPGEAMKLKPVRIGLFDQYGGSMQSGWTRWLFEQFEFPYQLVYPQTIDAGELKSRYDVLVFPDGAFRRAGLTGRGLANAAPANIPTEYKTWTGRISEEKSIAQLRKFLESGGSVVTIGSSTGMGELLGVPVKNYLTEKAPDGSTRNLPKDKFYIPGSLLKANIDNTDPVAYGMPAQVDVVFDNSPVFRLQPDANLKHASAVAWFSGPAVLDSGWAWGQQYLDGGTAIVDASVGEGKLVLLGPEVAFRAQPHATFKLLFNAIFAGQENLTK